MGISFIFLVLFFGFLFLGYRRRKERMTILKRHGIPGPEPNFFTGNLKDYESTPNVLWDSYLIDRYGSIVGYYLGAKPVILIRDVKLLDIIQRNPLFLDRPRRVPGGINPDPHRALMLGNLPVQKWYKLRKILGPSFNSLNLQEMTTSILTLIETMLDQIESNEEIDMYLKFKQLTLDLIGKVGFGLNSNVLENPNDPLLPAVAAEFSKSTNTMLVHMYLCFPEFAFILHPIRVFWERIRVYLGWSESSPLWKQGKNALTQRMGEKRNDLLQKLLNADLSPDQVVANSVLFFEAGYETLSSGLAFIVHLLVNHSNVQARLRQELNEYLAEHSAIDFRVLNNLPFMNLVIKESLRLFPPQTTFIGRAGMEDLRYEREDGTEIVIPKGTHLQVALWQIHHSPEVWKDPEVFDPERFVDNHYELSGCWQPFGRGKRNCIGKGFANLVMKLVLAKLFSKFILGKSTKTEEMGHVNVLYKTATMTPMNGSWVITSPSAA